MKKMTAVFVLLVIALSLLSACQAPASGNAAPPAVSADASVPTPAATPERTTTPADNRKALKQIDGSELVFDAPPAKVLVLSSTTLELLDAVGVTIAATSSLSSKPALAAKFAGAVDVGMATKPDMEKIAEVKPDIIIAGAMFMNMKEQFDAQGYKTWFVNNQTYDDTLKLIEDFGYLFDKKVAADALIQDFETRKQAVLDACKDAPKKTVMIIFGAGNQVMLGSDQCYSGSLANLLGHRNVADGMDLTGATSGYIPFSLETALATQPDVILRVAHGNPDETKKMFDDMFDRNPAYNAMKAVSEGKVYDLSYELFFSNPGLKCIDALENLSELIGQ